MQFSDRHPHNEAATKAWTLIAEGQIREAALLLSSAGYKDIGWQIDMIQGFIKLQAEAKVKQVKANKSYGYRQWKRK